MLFFFFFSAEAHTEKLEIDIIAALNIILCQTFVGFIFIN